MDGRDDEGAPVARGTRVVPALVTASSVTVVGGTFAPWLRSGRRERSSYELLAVLERIGLAPGGWAGTAVRLWPLVPLLATSAAVLAWIAWRCRDAGVRSAHLVRGAGVAAAVLGCAGALHAGGFAAVVLTRADASGASIGLGPAVTAVGAAALLVSSALAPFASARARPQLRPPVPSAHADSR